MPAIPTPAVRPLRIFATDPMQGRAAGNRTTIAVENEVLAPGPCGERLEVVDFDGSNKIFYEQVDLDDKAILMQGGLDPSEADPRFHQQMVYAVASRTLENFDRALGRRVNLRKGGRLRRLRLFPHAFQGQNAFYDRDLHAILFGYFRADPDDPGPNLPGQTVFTCLSHDIIAHEMTHAIVDQLRRYFLEPSNHDVLAFHEGFSDIVALFQHFSFRDLLREEIQKWRGDLRQPTLLVELARQFGYASGTGRSLRSALDDPDRRLLESVTEPHDRGSILVAAVFDGFFSTYQARIGDLVRIATGGTGELPPGDLHPDLVARIATEAAKAAQHQLDMSIRAFDYLPPVDITFGDYLRALVTADFEVEPADQWGQRGAVIEGFRRRGIYPSGAVSLAEESLKWATADLPPLDPSISELLQALLLREASRFSKRSANPSLSRREKEARDLLAEDERDEAVPPSAPRPVTAYERMRTVLHSYASRNVHGLRLDPTKKIQVGKFNTVFRVAPNGALLVELVAQFIQTDEATIRSAEWGGVPVRGGTTIVAGVDGIVRYVIAKPLPGPHLGGSTAAEARLRVDRQHAFVADLDARDQLFPYMDQKALLGRMKARMSIRALHAGHRP